MFLTLQAYMFFLFSLLLGRGSLLPSPRGAWEPPTTTTTTTISTSTTTTTTTTTTTITSGSI